MEDGNNLDAFVQAAFLFPLPEALKALENAEAKGEFAPSHENIGYGYNPSFRAGRGGLKQRFGMDCFDDGSKEVGMFYSILETRPYMRVLQSQVRLYFEDGQFGKSAYVFPRLTYIEALHSYRLPKGHYDRNVTSLPGR
jgi:hypothetical protein